MRILFIVSICLLIFSGCERKVPPSTIAFEVFCEMVANDAKPIALSHPMNQNELEENLEQFQVIAEKYGVLLFRESEFPVTSLFPSSVTNGKEVILIYKGLRLTQYQQFKQDLPALKKQEAARRFGRLLGYTPHGINDLLMQNTNFKTLSNFGVTHQVTHLYYQDIAEAQEFYRSILGLPEVNGSTFRIGEDAWIQLHAFSEDHPAGQPKSTAIALLTNQLPEWYAYALENEIPIKYSYKPRAGGPHDGFVAVDPGGYVLEFEEFKQHAENELFMAALHHAPVVNTNVESLAFFGSITWTYHNDLLKMQRFYEEVLGFRMVADQGWTKIYQTSPSGFIGLVDERRGMMDYAEDKAIELEWRLAQVKEASEYYQSTDYWKTGKGYLLGPENYRYLLR